METMEKISVSDLSVGDWLQARMVKWDYEDLDITPPMRVAEISSDEVMLQLGSVKHYAFVDDLQPIPITAEVLEKNGLVDAEFSLLMRLNNSPIEGICPIKINYIHELQHILRLTKTDKEIVL